MNRVVIASLEKRIAIFDAESNIHSRVHAQHIWNRSEQRTLTIAWPLWESWAAAECRTSWPSQNQLQMTVTKPINPAVKCLKDIMLSCSVQQDNMVGQMLECISVQRQHSSGGYSDGGNSPIFTRPLSVISRLDTFKSLIKRLERIMAQPPDWFNPPLAPAELN